jgi:hypothetical protein
MRDIPEEELKGCDSLSNRYSNIEEMWEKQLETKTRSKEADEQIKKWYTGANDYWNVN